MGFTVGETVVYPHHGAALIEAIEREVERRFDDAPVPLPRPVVTACRYRNDANLLGALWHHLKPSASAPVPGEPG